LIEPFDPVVFMGGSARDGLAFAAPSQIAADLLGSGPSGGGMAEAVMRQTWPGAALAKPAGER
jgi:hypothetical protein